jgi:hypothetical protein
MKETVKAIIQSEVMQKAFAYLVAALQIKLFSVRFGPMVT